MKLILALLLIVMPLRAATSSLVGGVRMSTDTTGTNTIAANVVITNLTGVNPRTGLMLRDLQATNSVKVLSLTASRVAGVGADKTLTNTSVTLTTLAGLAGAFITPQMYGAAGDGSTDDTAAWQACLTASASGRAILAPAGSIYKVINTLNPPAGVVILGYGAKVIKTNTASAIFALGDNSTMLGLELQGTGNSTYDDAGRAITIIGTVGAYATNVILRDLYLHDLSGYGVWAEFAANVDVLDSRIYNVGYAGVIGLSVTDMASEGLHIKGMGPGDAGNAYGVSYTRTSLSTNLATYPRSYRSRVVNCIIEDNNLWEGLDTHGGESIQFIGNIITNCPIGIAVVPSRLTPGVDGWAPINCQVIGNVVYGGGGYGIAYTGAAGASSGAVLQYSTSGIIANNTLYNCGESSNSISGAIYVHSTQGLSITGNTLNQSRANGVLLYADNLATAVVGNTIVDVWDDSYTAPSGINLRDINNQVAISGNSLIRTNTSLGTYVSVRGVQTVTPAANKTQMGPNINTFTEPYVGLIPTIYSNAGDTNASFAVLNTADQNFFIGPSANEPYLLSVRKDEAALANTIMAHNGTAAGGATVQVKSDSASGGLRAYSSTYSEGAFQGKVGLSLESTATALLLAGVNTNQTIDAYAGSLVRNFWVDYQGPHVTDDAYGVGWNGSTVMPTKNAVYDIVETKQAAFTTAVGVTNIANVLSGVVSAGTNIVLTTNGNAIVVNAGVNNWTNSGTTNSTLAGGAYAHLYVATNQFMLFTNGVTASLTTSNDIPKLYTDQALFAWQTVNDVLWLGGNELTPGNQMSLGAAASPTGPFYNLYLDNQLWLYGEGVGSNPNHYGLIQHDNTQLAISTGYTGAGANKPITLSPGAVGIQTDASSTAGQTRLLIWDVDNNTLERVTVGAADSGGAGYKVLRIPN